MPTIRVDTIEIWGTFSVRITGAFKLIVNTVRKNLHCIKNKERKEINELMRSAEPKRLLTVM
jgi:V8-like Glu-specific endopeptidase